MVPWRKLRKKSRKICLSLFKVSHISYKFVVIFSLQQVTVSYFLPLSHLKMTAESVSVDSVSPPPPFSVMLVCNKPRLRTSDSVVPFCQCVCCHEWDLVSDTESPGFLRHVLTHPYPSQAKLCACVFV